jgi:hypothetical protein
MLTAKNRKNRIMRGRLRCSTRLAASALPLIETIADLPRRTRELGIEPDQAKGRLTWLHG